MVVDKFIRTNIAIAGIFLLPACGGGGATSPEVPGNRPAVVGAESSIVTWSDGQQIPASFSSLDFGGHGPLYQLLPTSPQLDPNSANEISYYFAGNAPEFEVGWIDADKSQAQYDFTFPVYVATASDPLVTILCNHILAATCDDNGVKINMPALAQRAGGGDEHLAVLEPNGLEYDFWLVASTPPYSAGSTFSASGEGHFSTAGSNDGDSFVAPGFNVNSATASGIALSNAQIYTSEFAAGIINHAISFVLPCGTNAWVWPSSQASGICANGAGAPVGARFWWKPTDAQTNAMSLSRDITTVLVAMHHYGGYFTNNGGESVNINGLGGGMLAHIENQEPYWIYGKGTDPALNYVASAPGWNHIVSGSVNRYLLTVLGSSVDFLDNLKVVAPCVTKGTC